MRGNPSPETRENEKICGAIEGDEACRSAEAAEYRYVRRVPLSRIDRSPARKRELDIGQTPRHFLDELQTFGCDEPSDKEYNGTRRLGSESRGGLLARGRIG